MININRKPWWDELRASVASFRQDVIDRWAWTHPGEPPPQSIRHVIRLRVAEEAAHLRGLDESRNAELLRSADEYATATDGIQGVPLESVDAVKNAVRSAYWSINRQATWIYVVKQYGEVLGFLAGSIGLLMIVTGVVRSWSTSSHETSAPLSDPSVDAYSIALTLVVVLVVIRIMESWLAVLPFPLARGGSWLLRIGVVVFAFWGGWQPHVEDLTENSGTRLPHAMRNTWQQMDWNLLYALQILAAFFIVAAIPKVINSIAYRIKSREPENVLACANLLIEFHQLALASQRSLNIAGHRESEGYWTYLVSSERAEIVKRLETVALLAERRWRKSLKIGERLLDRSLAQVADGIAIAARRWKPLAAVGGSRLHEMHAAFVSALVHAAEGQWDQIAADISDKEMLGRRLLRAARRVAAVTVMGGAVIVVTVRPFGLPSTAPAVDSLLLVLAALVSIALDPTIIDRLANAARLTGSIHR